VGANACGRTLGDQVAAERRTSKKPGDACIWRSPHCVLWSSQARRSDRGRGLPGSEENAVAGSRGGPRTPSAGCPSGEGSSGGPVGERVREGGEYRSARVHTPAPAGTSHEAVDRVRPTKVRDRCIRDPPARSFPPKDPRYCRSRLEDFSEEGQIP
jgi:hypothetical protein